MKRRTFIHHVVIGHKNLSLRIKALVWITLGAIVFFGVPATIRYEQNGELQKARLYFSVPGGTIATGQTFAVEARLQTNGTAVNAVTAHITYSPLFLTVTNITTENSFCTFYLENSFDTIKGEVNVSCGVPNPGFLGDSVVVHMTVQAKVAGSTEFSFGPNTEVLANDGHGSNVTQSLHSLPITITQLF